MLASVLYRKARAQLTKRAAAAHAVGSATYDKPVYAGPAAVAPEKIAAPTPLHAWHAFCDGLTAMRQEVRR